MAIISFWNNGETRMGQSSNIAAIATYLGVNHNYKILILDTKFNDYFYQDCYWGVAGSSKVTKGSYVGIGEGIKGLSRAILSNKISPEIVTNYTKIVFNENRLEVLTDTGTSIEEYEMHKNIFNDIIKMANRFYDLVFIDIDSNLGEDTTNTLLRNSDIIIPCLSQNVRNINKYVQEKPKTQSLEGKLILPIIGRCDPDSKLSTKNISKYIRAKKDILDIKYNTLFMDACNEGKVSDYFIKFRNVGKKDKNAPFVYSVMNTADKIILSLQELQMRI